MSIPLGRTLPILLTDPITRAQACKSAGLQGSQEDQVWPLAADEIQSQREEWWRDKEGNYFSEANTWKTVAKTVSKVLKIVQVCVEKMWDKGQWVHVGGQ